MAGDGWIWQEMAESGLHGLERAGHGWKLLKRA